MFASAAVARHLRQRSRILPLIVTKVEVSMDFLCPADATSVGDRSLRSTRPRGSGCAEARCLRTTAFHAARDRSGPRNPHASSKARMPWTIP
jgi:hypothetical protein